MILVNKILNRKNNQKLIEKGRHFSNIMNLTIVLKVFKKWSNIKSYHEVFEIWESFLILGQFQISIGHFWRLSKLSVIANPLNYLQFSKKETFSPFFAQCRSVSRFLVKAIFMGTLNFNRWEEPILISFLSLLLISAYLWRAKSTYVLAYLSNKSMFLHMYFEIICTLCCKCLGSFAFLWCKMPMFRRAGMRKGGKPLPLAFQYLIFIV